MLFPVMNDSTVGNITQNPYRLCGSDCSLDEIRFREGKSNDLLFEKS